MFHWCVSLETIRDHSSWLLMDQSVSSTDTELKIPGGHFKDRPIGSSTKGRNNKEKDEPVKINRNIRNMNRKNKDVFLY